MTTDIMDIFPDRVQPEPNSGCWLWTAGGAFYGWAWFRGTSLKAHRLSYQLVNGEVPDGLHVLHKCDTPCCCNPAHLYAGTPKQNAKDRADRNRLPILRGAQHPNAKLTEDAVREIRSITPGCSLPAHEVKALAAKFGVTPQNIRNVRERGWSHVCV